MSMLKRTIAELNKSIETNTINEKEAEMLFMISEMEFNNACDRNHWTKPEQVDVFWSTVRDTMTQASRNRYYWWRMLNADKDELEERKDEVDVSFEQVWFEIHSQYLRWQSK